MALLLAGLLPVAALAAPKPAAQKPPAHPNLPHMQIQAQYAGPLQDTIIQRLRDPVDGTICYIYLPITAQHSDPLPNGFVQYGSNTIGSISCLPPH